MNRWLSQFTFLPLMASHVPPPSDHDDRVTEEDGGRS